MYEFVDTDIFILWFEIYSIPTPTMKKQGEDLGGRNKKRFVHYSIYICVCDHITNDTSE
jgi:hypothetical protein